MKDKYYLALADEVELNNRSDVKNSVIRLIILEVVLQIYYQLYPLLLKFADRNRIVAMLILLAFIATFVGAAKYFSLATKIFNKRVKPLAKWLITVIVIIFGLQVLLDILKISSVVKLSMPKIIGIGLAALTAAVCEEFLFRGILFNIFLLIFHKSKYNIFWTAVVSSAVFGFFHLINLPHQPLISTIGEIIIAFLLGLTFSYLHIWTNGISWCIVLHFLWDFTPQLAKADLGNPNIPGVVMMNVPVIIIMLICIYAFNRRYLKLKDQSK